MTSIPHSETNRFKAAIAAAAFAPTADDLATAPVLTHWSAGTYRGMINLIGKVVAHPLLGTAIAEGKGIMTSPVVAIDPDRRWARTVSRWYRLDRAYPNGEHVSGGMPFVDPIDLDEVDAQVAQAVTQMKAELDAR